MVFGRFIRLGVFTYHYATKPYYRKEAKRTFTRQYREWKTFDRPRHLQKAAALVLIGYIYYYLFYGRLTRLIFRLPSEDPNYMMKTEIFHEEQQSLWKRRAEAERKLHEANATFDNSASMKPNTPLNPFGDTVQSRGGGSPLYTSGDGDIPSPASALTGVRNGQA